MKTIRTSFLALAVLLAPIVLQAGEGRIRTRPNAVKGEYIVVLEDDTPRERIRDVATELSALHGGRIGRVWRDALKGFVVQLTREQAEKLSSRPEVKYVEENALMYLSATAPTNIDPACDPGPGQSCVTADNRLWHLDVMDQKGPVWTNEYSYCTDGSGVYVYVVDTGVMRSHREFNNDANRVLNGYDATGDPDWFPAWNPCHGPAVGDERNFPLAAYGHGTGVGSLVAGSHLGVARATKIVPVKVLPCGADGAKSLQADTAYVATQIVFANSTHYRVKTGGTTGSQATYPHTWAWPPNTCCTTWGTVELEYYGSLPQGGTAAMLADGLDWILRPAAQGGNPNPKSPAVVTLSTYRLAGENGAGAVEDAIGSLLKYNNGQGITVIASANNQDANACDTTPSRMSRNNPNNPHDPNRPYKVITAGGMMIRNNIDPNPATGGSGVQLPEPAYNNTKPSLFARWRCHAGDTDNCQVGWPPSPANIYSNPPPTVPDPATDPSGFIATLLGSNGGQCVTLFAPAKNIPVANQNAITRYRDARASGQNGSGTSWSAPIVAAMAARILQNNPSYTVDDVHTALIGLTTPDLDPLELNPPGVSGTPNAVLHLTDVVASLPASIAAAPSGPTTINVSAGGTTSLTYELWQVNPEFDFVTYHSNAAAGTKIAGPQASSSFSVNVTTPKAFFARVRSSCDSADTNIAIVAPVVAAPTGLLAGATGGTVTVTWNAVANVDNYEVERKIGTAAWTAFATPTATSLNDTPTVPTGVVLYRVRGVRYGIRSDPSNHDVAYTKTFTDDPPLTGAPRTIIKARHIVELRSAVNGLRELSGQANIFTGSALDENTVRTQVIDDADFTVLMSTLNTARNAAGLAGISFQTTPTQGAPPASSQLTDLRAGVK
ncbi:MAG TPA: S8 family serine peptidase [Thermoanaerobaculia bacterium]|jgi:hypothetical protein|nr:S8 family serine peptidase [Thermoanaerobaculia bacterium]